MESKASLTLAGDLGGTGVTFLSPCSEAVTQELEELSLQPGPSLLPIEERKHGERA